MLLDVIKEIVSRSVLDNIFAIKKEGGKL